MSSEIPCRLGSAEKRRGQVCVAVWPGVIPMEKGQQAEVDGAGFKQDWGLLI